MLQTDMETIGRRALLFPYDLPGLRHRAQLCRCFLYFSHMCQSLERLEHCPLSCDGQAGIQTLVSLVPMFLSLHLLSDKFANNMPHSSACLACGTCLLRVGH